MLDFEISKKLNIKADKIDLDKSYYSFNPNTWHDEIVDSFNMINGHKITNGPMERVNRDIKTIFGISFGSTNFPRMRNRIIYCINQDVPILAWRKKETNKKVGKPRGKYKTKK